MSWAPTMSMWSGWAYKEMFTCPREKVGKECDERCIHYPIEIGLKVDGRYVAYGSRKGAVVQPTAEGEER